jgi:hypothetical protein
VKLGKWIFHNEFLKHKKKMIISEEKKYENYKRLGVTARFIESCLKDGKGITEDWIEEHKEIILEYRDIFPNLATVNLETDGLDSTFYKNAYDAEIYLSWLVKNLKEFGSPSSLRMYMKLNVKLKILTKDAFSAQEKNSMFDNLLGCMDNLTIK